jgi:hypothetical protein
MKQNYITNTKPIMDICFISGRSCKTDYNFPIQFFCCHSGGGVGGKQTKVLDNQVYDFVENKEF